MPLRKASRAEPYLMVGARGCGRGAASSAKAALEPSSATLQAAKRLDVRIGLLLGGPARMRHRTVACRSDRLRVLPEIARTRGGFPRLPFRPAAREFCVGKLHHDGALDGVERDDVTVANECDGPTHRSLWTGMADAEAARRTGETAVGNERDLVAHALAVKRRR